MIHEMLITSVACGDEKLNEILQGQIDTIWCMSGGCSQDLQYLKSQLALIEFAQAFTRNMIDTSTSRMNMVGVDRFDSKNQRDNQAQRTAQGNRCAWSKATSFQQFQRDSESHARGKSDSFADTEGASTSYLYDRSQQASVGWANNYDFSSSAMRGFGFDRAASCTTQESESFAGTPQFAGGASPTPPTLAGFNIINSGTWWTFDFLGLWSLDVPYPPWVGFTIGGLSTGNPGPTFPGCGVNPNQEDCPALPSYGRSKFSHTELSVTIPFVGALTQAADDGEEFRQSFICSSGNSTTIGNSNSYSEYISTDDAQSKGETKTHDESESTNDRHKSASSYRDSHSEAHAGASDTMRAHGETHSGSDSASHAEGQGSGQGTAWSKDHADSQTNNYSDQVRVDKTRYWSQIFRSLADLHKRVWGEVQAAERAYMALLGPKIARMTTKTMSIACNPKAQKLAYTKPCCGYATGSMH